MDAEYPYFLPQRTVLEESKSMVLYHQNCFMNSQPLACGERVIRLSVQSLLDLQAAVGSHDGGASS